jgi:hypothetical protein
MHYTIWFFIYTPAGKPNVLPVNSSIVCFYDGEKWVGLIEEVQLLTIVKAVEK